MKYIRYASIVLFKILSKVIGLLWYWIAVPFRGYARNTVYNYVLENNIYLPRLIEREPVLVKDKYMLKNVHKVKHQGYINYRKVNKLEYYLVLWLLWIWVDDDSNHDTMSGKYINGKVYGNSFDLGDLRAKYPEFEFKKSSLWLIRNTAYNFNYMFEECDVNSKNFFYIHFEKLGIHFGYIPKGVTDRNKRVGRLVWFKEDYDRLIKKV